MKSVVSHCFLPRFKFIQGLVKSTSVLIILGISALRCAATIDATLQMQLGNPSGALSDTNNHSHYLIQRTVEAIDFSDALGEPNWASWDLTASDVGSSGRNSSFYTDTNLPPNFYAVQPGDYSGSGFDRGHMCPSGDRTDTVDDNKLVFFMSNIIPQDSINNQGVWGTFESYCRTLAQANNELLIICGPSIFNGARINSNGVASIPAYVWKIVVVVSPGTGTAASRITATNRVIVVKIPNNDSATNTWPTYVTSASQIEVDTGYTFFSALPTNVAAALRNKVDGQTNPPPVIFAFSPTNGAPGTNVVITGTNFTSALAVSFNGANAAFTLNSATQISAVVPTNATTGAISVSTTSGTAISANLFTVNGTATTNGNGSGGGVTVTNYSGTLIGWDMNPLTGGTGNFGVSPFTPTTNAPYTVAVGLTRGSGVTTNGSAAARAWGATAFSSTNEAAAIAANQFVTFGLTATNGYSVSYTTLSRFDYRRSGTGPANGVLQYQVGSGLFTDLATLSYTNSTSSGGTNAPIDLSAIAALQNVGAGTNVTFRIVNFNGGSSGTWYVYDQASSTALDLAVQGVVTSTTAAAQPTLAIQPTGTNTLLLSWPSPSTGFVLQQNANLATTNWITVSPTPVDNGTTVSVVVTPSAGQWFYRLKK